MRAFKRTSVKVNHEAVIRCESQLLHWILLSILALAALASSGLAKPTALVSAEATQEPEAPTQASFDSSVVELQDLLSRRRWKKAIRALNELLEAHAGAEYVLPHLQGFREELRRASFWKTQEEPVAKDLVSGELLRYVPGNGSVKIRYEARSLGDFEEYGDSVIHPMYLRSPWTVTIEGTPEELARRTYFFESAPGDGYSITFGSWVEGARTYTNHVYLSHGKGVAQELGKEAPKELPLNAKEIKAKLRVTDRDFKVTYDGKTLFTQRLSDEKLRRLALVPPRQDGGMWFGEITIEGRIDPGWMTGILDAEVSKQREDFDLSWKAPAIFDFWEPAKELRRVDFSLEQLLERLVVLTRFETEIEQDLYDTFTIELGNGRAAVAKAMMRLIELPTGALTESASTFLMFNFALELGYYKLAVSLFDRLEFSEECSLEQAILSADLHLRGGMKKQAEAEFRLLATQHPMISFLHRRHAETLLLMGKADEAHTAISQGKSTLPFSKELRDLELMIIKATKGPAWERTYENRGKHFLVRTDLDRKFALEARRVLDEAWERCAEFFGPLEGVPSPLPADPEERKVDCHSIAYLFAGEASYLDFVNGVADDSQENTLGLYNKYLKHIAAWNQPNKSALWQTLRHEVAHRYLDLALGERIPRWLNEGLAEHFAASWLAPKKKGDSDASRLALGNALTDKELPHLFQFMQHSEEEFMRDPQLGYAMAHAIVYCFYGENEKSLISRLLEALRRGEDPRFAIDERLAEFDPIKMNKVFMSIVNGLKLLVAIQPVTFEYGR